jgi:hypothetical protein
VIRFVLWCMCRFFNEPVLYLLVLLLCIRAVHLRSMLMLMFVLMLMLMLMF